MRRPAFAVLLVVSLVPAARAETIPDAAELAKLTARLAPVDLKADLSKLPASEKAALVKILAAAAVMDTLFLRQVHADNEKRLTELEADKTPLGRARLHAFKQNKGPWLRMEEDRPFLPDVGPKPLAGNFYPAGSTRAEVDTWLKSLGPDDHAAATGFFTTIRRGQGNQGNNKDGKFQIVPYSREYESELKVAAARLREAAALTAEPSLRTFLEARADAFASNNYYPSDVAWMKLDSRIEPTIGPYEVYEDGWFNAKASWEAFVTIRDDAETAKLAKFGGELQDIEDHLPIDPKLRNPNVGAIKGANAPIRVVNSIFSSGDANRGVQTAAFNLPNDEKITAELGTKRTMLKNVQEAKFKIVLQPISRIALAPADQKKVAFDAFFTHILMHELMHGLGPHEIKVKGIPTSVRQSLQETYSAIEEAKADISGLFALQYLIDKGVIAKSLERTMYTTFLASCFRSIRFGLKEAHGKGIALQLTTLLDAGAFKVAKNGTFSVDAGKVKGAVRDLTAELMTLQAAGDRGKALELLKTRAVIRPEVQKVLDRLNKIPVDIEPRFVTAEQLRAAAARGK
jgi:Peptidase family M49